MSNIRQSPNFNELARNIANSLATKYKEENPNIIFSVDELSELFYKRIMTSPNERISKSSKKND